MPRCALVGAVGFNARHFASQEFDCVVAVDRGYAALQSIGCAPDLVVGDFDSLGYVPQDAEVLQFPAEKDESDMELAVRGAAEGGCDELIFYGALGARLDHTLANLQVMAGCARRGLGVCAVGDDYTVAVLDGAGRNRIGFEAFEPPAPESEGYACYLSVFAYGGTAKGVTEAGLKYALVDADIPDDVSLGLSNEFTGKPAAVKVGQGTLFVTFPLAAWGALIR